MTEAQAAFSANSAGIITAVGWGDPSNVWPGGTHSQPVAGDVTPEATPQSS